jgi:hypothetical protein
MGRRIARAWAPISERLHEAMDRLEERDRDSGRIAGSVAPSGPATPETEPEPESRVGTPMRHVAGPDRRPVSAPAPEPQPEPARQARYDVSRITGGSPVGRPRPVPPISGPITVAPPEPAADGSRVIDLRDEDRVDADRETGSARRTR